MSNHEIEHLRNLEKAYKERLNVLEVQLAKYGMSCPPYILVEIENIKAQLSKIQSSIKDSRNEFLTAERRKLYLFRGFAGFLIVGLFFFFGLRAYGISVIWNPPWAKEESTPAPTRVISPSPVVNVNPIYSSPKYVPEDTVNTYFHLIESGQYNDAWSMLTQNFRERHNPQGYDIYVEYWQYHRPAKITTNSLGESGQRYVIRVEIEYYDRQEEGTDRFHFAMVFEGGQWKIDEYCDERYAPKCSDAGF